MVSQENTHLQGAIENGNYIGLALMIITSLLAMYSLFRILFIMYFGDNDGEQVDFNPLPKHRKTILGILVAVVLAMGIAAPVVMNATENATKLNMDDNYFHSIVNSHLKEGINETSCIEHINRILWVLFQDEDSFQFSTFVSGFIIGLIVIYILHRFFGQSFYPKKIWIAIKFLGVYLYQLTTSSISIINYILFKTRHMNPGLLTYETNLKMIGQLRF